MKRTHGVPIAILFTAIGGAVGLTVHSARAADEQEPITNLAQLLNVQNMKPLRGRTVKFLDVEVMDLGTPPHAFFIGDAQDQIYVVSPNQRVNVNPGDRVALTGIIVQVPPGNELLIDGRLRDAIVERSLKHGHYILASSVMPAHEALSQLRMTPK